MANETNIHRESRLAKLRTLQEKGYNPYPYKFVPTIYAAELQEKYKEAIKEVALIKNNMKQELKTVIKSAKKELK